VTGGWLRPAVFGMMDGLVSNTALIAGVAGGGVEGRSLVLTGLAGLAAGAFSMATGEYTSVAAQTELTRAEIEIEKAELRRVPQAEEAELAGIYRARGVDEKTAREVARQLSADPEQAWRVHTREELGVDPDALPSPRVAAVSSFGAFSLGALLPLLPYLLGAHSLLLAVVLAGLALFGVGALVSRFTNRTALYSGARQLVLGGLAAGCTHLVGLAVGTGV
jgi:VIT1/CCC1 family predicted Fe2+/Mn2+ transporter